MQEVLAGTFLPMDNSETAVLARPPAAVVAEPAAWEPGGYVGHYLLLTKLAAGGMGEVWLARSHGPKGFEKLVAVKRISGNLCDDPEFVEMFADEARLAAQLNHPNIVQTHEFAEQQGIYYLVMEFLSGENLSRILRVAENKGLPVPIPLAVSIAADVATALDYAHRRTGMDGMPLGIVHRDISPQNIFGTYEGLVKVVDFGVAKAEVQSMVTQAGRMKGKAGYMAPEQARGDVVDHRADQFALGVVLFEMLTATRLIPSGDSDARLLRVIQHTEVLPTASSRNPAVPEELSRLVTRALEQEPDARFPTMESFGRALRDWLRQNTQPDEGECLAEYMRSLFAGQIQARAQWLTIAQRSIASPSLIQRELAAEPSSKALETVALSPRRDKPSRTLKSRRIRFSTLVVLGALTMALGLWVWKPLWRPPPALLASAAWGTARSSERQPTPPEPAALPTPAEAASASVEPSPPTPTSTRPARRRVRPKPALGRLSLQTIPWTVVYAQNQRLGETPLVEQPLAVGTHRLKLVNEEQGGSTIVEVEVQPNKTTVVKLRL